MSIEVSLIIFLAVLSALTLKPIIKAFEASARLISDSVIPPTEFETISISTSSVASFINESFIASELP